MAIFLSVFSLIGINISSLGTFTGLGTVCKKINFLIAVNVMLLISIKFLIHIIN